MLHDLERNLPAVSISRHHTVLRLADIFISIAALLIFAPILALTACAVMFGDEGPIIFAQRRLGWQGRSFRCFKFRTMVIDADERLRALLVRDERARAEWMLDHKLKSDPRITPMGRVLRKFSLDELPQLFNVLLGDMSLVGPRPIVAAEAERYGIRYWTYCRVRPGITGIWQISGRNDVHYRRRVAMDVIYVKKMTIGLYLRVLMGTPGVLLSRRGAY